MGFVFDSAAAEWIKQGEDLLRKDRANEAAICFRRGGQFLRAKYTDTSAVWEEARLSQDAQGLAKAADQYEQLALEPEDDLVQQGLGRHKVLSKCARCWEDAQEYRKAAEVYIRVDEFTLSAKCFERAELFKKAADAWSRSDEPHMALDACMQGKLFEQALGFAGDLEDQSISAKFAVRLSEALRGHPPSRTRSAQMKRCAFLQQSLNDIVSFCVSIDDEDLTREV
mmetsp:Transcript_10984/g.34572  ORF Transcript_10984/g.34572 Transcript_10984/m.34572 type:complete len:226 (+) Transcript_10984:63-740(+)